MDLLEEYKGMIIPNSLRTGLKIRRPSHTFKVSVDYRTVPNASRYQDNTFVKFRSVKPVSKKEFMEDLARMKTDMMNLEENYGVLESLVDQAPKKKDGTFINGRVLFRIPYLNTAELHKSGWCDDKSWDCWVLKARTVDDTEVLVSFERDSVGVRK